MAAGDKRRVRLVLGTGPRRLDVGETTIEEMEDGSYLINASFDHPDLPDTITEARISASPWEERD